MNSQQGTLRQGFLARLAVNVRKQARQGIPKGFLIRLAASLRLTHAKTQLQEWDEFPARPAAHLQPKQKQESVPGRASPQNEFMVLTNLQLKDHHLRSECSAMHPLKLRGVVGCDPSAQATETSRINSWQGTLRSDFLALLAATLQSKKKTGVSSRQGPTSQE